MTGRRVVLVASGTGPRSRSDAVGAHVAGLLAGRGHPVATTRVRDLPAEALLHGRTGHPTIADALALVAAADAVVVTTPVYQASFAGILKVFLDLVPRAGLRGKDVLPLMVGGSRAHVLALDYALRPVLQSLGAPTVHAGRFVLDSEVVFEPGGRPHLAPDAAGDVDAAALAFALAVEARTTLGGHLLAVRTG